MVANSRAILKGAGTVEDFESYRPLLFSIAYRMLGSASEAEDIVQDAYLRYSSAQVEEIRSLKAFLSTVVTRLCIDRLKSARVEREQYIGPWLPEPVLTNEYLTPLQTTEQLESISMAFLVLLERLTPQERAVFLLHDVFDYDYQEISEILGKSIVACRQILHRAKERVEEARPRFEPSQEAHQQLIESFILACQHGDLDGLTNLLAQDAVVWSDGGGKTRAALRPINGRDFVLRFIMGLLSKAPPELRFTQEKINGRPAILTWLGEKLINVATLETTGGQIHKLNFVVNPEKLRYVKDQLQARS
jgi:RNA polymerase sigma-70 factor, ECF subfamily